MSTYMTETERKFHEKMQNWKNVAEAIENDSEEAEEENEEEADVQVPSAFIEDDGVAPSLFYNEQGGDA